MSLNNSKTTVISSRGSTAKITQPASSIADAAMLAPSQLEEALEERVTPDRRKKDRVLPEAIVDRRSSDRRTTSN